MKGLSNTAGEDACGAIIWFTGLSGAGKTTIAQGVFAQLEAAGVPVQLLDGDAVRQDLSRDLGYSRLDRFENVARVARAAKLFASQGKTVLVAMISPYRAMRDAVRTSTANFSEVFVDAPLSVCERRDVKGLYKKARAGQIQTFTGVSDPYEPPLMPELVCHTDCEGVSESITKVLALIPSGGYEHSARRESA